MDRSNQYERAFEAYLQHRKLCYVAVDETNRSFFDDAPIKSLDFIVHGTTGARLLVDIKGRRFPGGSVERPRPVWECWSTRDDIDGLDRWADVFGPTYRGVLVFAYRLAPEVPVPEATEDLWTWHDHRYLFRAVPVAEYRKQMRVRSPKWQTVSLPHAVFRRLVRPLSHLISQDPGVSRESAVRGQLSVVQC